MYGVDMQTQTLMDLTRAHPKALGQSFVIHRQIKGWTHEEAALRVGVPVGWYRDLEAGDHGVVEKPLIRALANAFDLRYRSLRLAFDRVSKVLKESRA